MRFNANRRRITSAGLAVLSREVPICAGISRTSAARAIERERNVRCNGDGGLMVAGTPLGARRPIVKLSVISLNQQDHVASRERIAMRIAERNRKRIITRDPRQPGTRRALLS